MLPIRILGTGIYAPREPIGNEELQSMSGLTFDIPKLEEKLGIRRRHIARRRGLDESTADFATQAAEAALADAGITPSDLGIIVVGSDTPEFISPGTAMVVQGRLQGGETWATAFDVNASCASFAIAFDTAARILASDPRIRYACVIGVYAMPAYVRADDAFGTFIFADGAGAVILERTPDTISNYIDGQHLTDGTQWNYIGIYAGGTRQPITHEVLERKADGLTLLQPLPGERNVRLWPMVIRQLLDKCGMNMEDVDHFIFTQINRSVIEQVMGILGRSMEDTTCAMDRYGYTGSACVPMAFHTAIREGRIQRGNKVLFCASGAGLAVGSNIFTY